MNWARGFKRITMLLSLVAATVSGICVGAIPWDKYCSAQKNWWSNFPTVVQTPSAKDIKEFEEWLQAMKASGAMIDRKEKWWHADPVGEEPPLEAVPALDIDAILSEDFDVESFNARRSKARHDMLIHENWKSAVEEVAKLPTLLEIRPSLLKASKVLWWQELSKGQLAGMCVAAGLGGAAAGFLGLWVVLGFGGLAVHRIVRWVVLGFLDK